MLPWAVLLPVLKRLLPLPRLVRLMWAEPTESRPPPERDDVLALANTLTRLLPLPSSGNCLARSLLAYRYLARGGFDPTLAVGISLPENGTPAGHAWIELAGAPMREPGGVAHFTRVVAFASGGSMQLETSDVTIPPASCIH